MKINHEKEDWEMNQQLTIIPIMKVLIIINLQILINFGIFPLFKKR